MSGQTTMNRRKKKTIDREEEIIRIVSEFDTSEDQQKVENIANFAFRLGSVDKYDFPLFEPEEDQSDSSD